MNIMVDEELLDFWPDVFIPPALMNSMTLCADIDQAAVADMLGAALANKKQESARGNLDMYI